MNSPSSWPARAAEFERVAAKLRRDVRRAVEVVAFIKAPKPPRCIECDANIGTVHFGFCSYFGDGAGEVVT